MVLISLSTCIRPLTTAYSLATSLQLYTQVQSFPIQRMLRLLTISLLFAVSLGLEAVSFGETKSAETLFQASTPSPTQLNNELSEPTSESSEHNEDLSESERVAGRTWFNMDDHFHNKDGDEWGLYVPIELAGGTTVDRRAIEKRAQKAGVVQIDCSMAPEVCRNAGFYQNCMMGAKGMYWKVTYKNGPLEPSNNAPKTDRNRYNSGVSTTYSTLQSLALCPEILELFERDKGAWSNGDTD